MIKTSLADARFELIKIRAFEIFRIFGELARGFNRKDPALFRCMILSLIIGGIILLQIDTWIFMHANIWRFYPSDGKWFRIYAVAMILAPTLGFGVWMRNDKKKFIKKLREVFETVGLKNLIGTYPNFLSLEPITGGTMKLRLTNGAHPLSVWTTKKEALEANLRVFIDEIKQIPERGIIEITFSYEPMPSKVTIENIHGYRDYKFLIGRDRMKSYIGDFSINPHFLIGGETGGGKSALMRQIVTTIKVNQPESKFLMVDLKGGVEFSHFGKFPGMEIITEVADVATALKTIDGLIRQRSQALKSKRLTKIEEFLATDEFRKMTVSQREEHVLGRRIFVVVDECAEIFLFGLGHQAKDTREIRGCMSTITRLGRFVGVHVILGTQRPDKQAVDPQVKTNLTTTICFRIHDLGGSLAVLGSGRATDLPKIPGRAILRTGSEEREIQTPFLDFGEAIKILSKKFKVSEIDNDGTLEDSKSTNDPDDDEKNNEPDSILT